MCSALRFCMQPVRNKSGLKHRAQLNIVLHFWVWRVKRKCGVKIQGIRSSRRQPWKSLSSCIRHHVVWWTVEFVLWLLNCMIVMFQGYMLPPPLVLRSCASEMVATAPTTIQCKNMITKPTWTIYSHQSHGLFQYFGGTFYLMFRAVEGSKVYMEWLPNHTKSPSQDIRYLDKISNPGLMNVKGYQTFQIQHFVRKSLRIFLEDFKW
jgi:hypothetical protein